MARKVDYHEYLASREWRLRRKGVIDAAEGICQRCGSAPIRNVHHTSYENIGHEKPWELIGVCKPCHEYLAGIKADDPALLVVRELLAKYGLVPVYVSNAASEPTWPPDDYAGGRSCLGASLHIDIRPEDADPPVPVMVRFPIGVGVVGYCRWRPRELD
ncbi:MAG: hypothetical protein Q8O40_08355 [Chloroflexota bacterium]|nr:hypothetical protein [Chloroflexota bacterium]